MVHVSPMKSTKYVVHHGLGDDLVIRFFFPLPHGPYRLHDYHAAL